MRNVIIIPDIEQDRRRRCAPRHHEGCEVCDLELVLNIDGDKNYEAEEGEEEAGCDEGEAPAGVVTCEGEEEEHYGTGDVRGDSI